MLDSRPSVPSGGLGKRCGARGQSLEAGQGAGASSH